MNDTPRQVVATGYGDGSVLEFVPAASGSPDRGEVTIEVRAIGVNPVDRKRYADRHYSQQREDSERFPLALGVEAAGVVIAVGPDALGPMGRIEVGDEVIAYRIVGAYAEQVTVPASAVVPKPLEMPWEQAACVMLAATTAAHTLATVAARPGQTVLVHGVSGSVGSAVAQLARLDHVRIVGTTSARSAERLRRFDIVPIAYGEGLLGRAERAATAGYDAVIDLVGTDEAIDTSLALVADRSRIVTVVAFDRARRDGFQALGGSAGQDEAGIAVRSNARLRIAAFAQAGQWHVDVAHTFDFTDVRRAHDMLAEGSSNGHIVLAT